MPGFRVLLALVCALVPTAAFADLAALEAAARKEGELTWYTAHYPIELAEEIGRAFTKKHEVKVNVVRTTGQIAYQRLRQDIKNNAANCDVFASTDVGHFVELKKEGRLEKYLPELTKEISPEFKGFDPDGFYHATSAGLIMLIYNTQKVKPEDAPKTWTETLQPKWKRQLATGHPGFSGYGGIWVVQMRKMYGWKFFEQMETLSPQIGRSMVDPVTMVSAGERTIGYTAENAALMSIARGNPIGMIYPSDGTILVIAPSAIMKNAKHPNAAKLFMEYLYSEDLAKVHATNFATPLRPDVPLPAAMKPIKDIKIVRPSTQELVDQVPEIIEKWRDTFGN
jgi:iron(III) transport system substrate-binding protein